MPNLLIKLPDDAGTNRELTGNLITVGRLPDNMLQINSDTVSSHHARFVVTGGNFRVEDLNSTNGTFVNGIRIKVANLHDSDKITFGTVECVLDTESSGPARPKPLLPRKGR